MLPYHTVSLTRQQFRTNLSEQMLATQLQLDLLRLASHFESGGILPAPTNLINESWRSIPNEMTIFSPWSLRKDTVFVPAFPPTPTTASKESGIMRASGWNEDSQLNRATPSRAGYGSVIPSYDEVYGTPIPSFEAPMTACSEHNSTTSATNPESPVSRFAVAQENFLLGTHRSNEEPLSVPAPPPSVESSPTPSVCDSQSSTHDDAVLNWDCSQMVTEGVDILMRQGTRALVEVLLQRGVEDYRSANPVATVAQTILGMSCINVIDKTKAIANGLRFGAMGMFRHYWKHNGAWKTGSETPLDNSYLTLRSVNIAGFLGSLFTTGIVTADDIHLCLGLLINLSVDFDRLCAMHALIVQANDKLCKSKNAAAIAGFREKLSVRYSKTGHLWGDKGHSRILVADIFSTIDGWFTTQALKRARSVSNSDQRALGSSHIARDMTKWDVGGQSAHHLSSPRISSATVGKT